MYLQYWRSPTVAGKRPARSPHCLRSSYTCRGRRGCWPGGSRASWRGTWAGRTPGRSCSSLKAHRQMSPLCGRTGGGAKQRQSTLRKPTITTDRDWRWGQGQGDACIVSRSTSTCSGPSHNHKGLVAVRPLPAGTLLTNGSCPLGELYELLLWELCLLTL